jgi:hypothetical protein
MTHLQTLIATFSLGLLAGLLIAQMLLIFGANGILALRAEVESLLHEADTLREKLFTLGAGEPEHISVEESSAQVFPEGGA